MSSNHKNNKNNKGGSLKPIIYLAIIPTLFIALIIGFTSKGQTASTEITNVASASSTYKLDKLAYSFGTISQRDGNVETTYKLTNTGSEDIYIKELYTSCMCTKAQIIFGDNTRTGLNGMKGHGGPGDFYVGKYIKAGETVDIRAIFDPNAHGPQGVGFIKRNITLDTNLKDNPTIQVSFDATVIR